MNIKQGGLVMRKTIGILIIMLFTFSLVCITGCKGKEVSEEEKIAMEQAEDEQKISGAIKENLKEGGTDEGMIEDTEKEPDIESEPGYQNNI